MNNNLSQALNEKHQWNCCINSCTHYSRTCLKQPVKNRHNEGLKDRWLLNAGLKYCRMLPRSILQYFWPALSDYQSWKSLLLSPFEWPFKTGLTVSIFGKSILYKWHWARSKETQLLCMRKTKTQIICVISQAHLWISVQYSCGWQIKTNLLAKCLGRTFVNLPKECWLGNAGFSLF